METALRRGVSSFADDTSLLLSEVELMETSLFHQSGRLPCGSLLLSEVELMETLKNWNLRRTYMGVYLIASFIGSGINGNSTLSVD